MEARLEKKNKRGKKIKEESLLLNDHVAAVF